MSNYYIPRIVKYIKQARRLFCFAVFCILVSNSMWGQLKVGDNVPNLVLSSTENSIQSYSFPYQNKVVLLLFWSTSVSKSKENIYKYKRLHAQYAKASFENASGFDFISVALQSDKVAWDNAIRDYDLSNFNNCIAQKGYGDFFVKAFHLTETPTSFLIDQFGVVLAVNPSLTTIIDYLNDNITGALPTVVQSQLSGNIFLDDKPLMNESLWLLSDKKDTLQSAILNKKGGFLFNNINPTYSYNLYVKPAFKIKDGERIFLTSLNNEIISNFKRVGAGYEYELINAELPYLKPFTESELMTQKEQAALDALYVSAVLFNAKTSVLPKDALSKLDTVIEKLKDNANCKLEIITHTDSQGDAAANLALSVKQGNSIVTYMFSKGIAKDRLTTIGKGETEITNTCRDGVNCNEQQHLANRRTEFKFYITK